MWTVVHQSGEDVTSRMSVVGGWIYRNQVAFRTQGYRQLTVSSVFVPDAGAVPLGGVSWIPIIQGPTEVTMRMDIPGGSLYRSAVAVNNHDYVEWFTNMTFVPSSPIYQMASTISAAAPAGTTSATPVMQGLGLTMVVPPQTVTPEQTAITISRVMLIVTGQIANTNNNGQAVAQLMMDIGNPPANGDPVTGTAIGEPVQFISTTGSGGGGGFGPFSQNILVENLIAGTSYWFDLALNAANGGTASLKNLQFTGFSLIDPPGTPPGSLINPPDIPARSSS